MTAFTRLLGIRLGSSMKADAPLTLDPGCQRKLLARKRPRLLPVYDQVVRCVLGRPKSLWLDLHAALRVDNWALHHELMALRQAADLPETVSALWVCDVVLWMHRRTDRQQGSCTGI
ncbi:hypothetical protein ASD08_15545 [Streptomyces sp. Root369]|nr:hypothetical protein ASD08_15545 [Streptomyces sp. Root369]